MYRLQYRVFKKFSLRIYYFPAPQAHDVSAADTCELFAGFGDCVEFPVVSSGVVGASFLGGIRSFAKSRPWKYKSKLKSSHEKAGLQHSIGQRSLIS